VRERESVCEIKKPREPRGSLHSDP